MELREIPGHSTRYRAGDDGHIYSMRYKTPLRLSSSLDGAKKYLTVWAYPNDRKRVTRSVHTLVCLAFHGERPNPEATVSHLNGDRLDNRPENLTWESQAENLSRKNDHGTHDRGLNNSRACLSKEGLATVRQLLSEGSLTQQEIADKVGISRTMVSRIKSGKKYGDS